MTFAPVIAAIYLLTCLAGLAAARHLARIIRQESPAHRARRLACLLAVPFDLRDLCWTVLFILSIPLPQFILTRFFDTAVSPTARIFYLHGGGLILMSWLLRRHARKVPINIDRRKPPALICRQLLRDLRKAGFFYLAALPFILLTGLLTHAAMSAAGQTPVLQDATRELLLQSSWLERLPLLVSALLTAPVFEEFFFRGMLLPLAVRAGGLIPGIIVTSAAFAIAHAHTTAILPLFVLAIFLSIAYIYTNSLRVTAAFHALFNSINIIMLFILT